MFAEMLLNSEVKIFLEAIDQFFEQESPINSFENEDFDVSDIEIEKMNDKFCDSLDEDEDVVDKVNLNNTNKDISTEFDSEEAPSYFNLFIKKKSLFMNEFLIIDQEKINKTKNQVFNNYCAELQMIENLKNIWN